MVEQNINLITQSVMLDEILTSRDSISIISSSMQRSVTVVRNPSIMYNINKISSADLPFSKSKNQMKEIEVFYTFN